jgi:hypothetical protein
MRVVSSRWHNHTAQQPIIVPPDRRSHAMTASRRKLVKASSTDWGYARRWIQVIDGLMNQSVDRHSLTVSHRAQLCAGASS